MVAWSTVPPVPRDRQENYPTLLYSWWCTGFSIVIICTRLCGRKVRSNVLFREDWIIMLALVPLLIRMALIHVVLIYGTNNIRTVGYEFTDTELFHRSIGARLVLAARIFYAMFIWLNKLTVSEFLKRITIRIWRKSYELTLHGIRIFLFVTFFVVVIATLTECHPFDHYWQVIPDPGHQCRQGYAHLISMGTCDIITDILLVAFPIPIVLRSGQNWKRKLQLASLFSLSIVMIAVTATRVPEVIWHLGRQQYRTVWASSEILASTAVSNAVILGSFVRDKGTKKNKYRRSQSVTDSIDRVSTRRPTMTALQQCGSDEDLFRFLGCRVPEHLQTETETLPRPAPAALAAGEMEQRRKSSRLSTVGQLQTAMMSGGTSSDSDDSLQKPPGSGLLPSPVSSTKRSVSFFDVGGLLEDGKPSIDSRARSTTLMESSASGTVAQDFATPSPEQSRRGSHAFLPDIGGLLPAGPARNGGTAFSRRQSDVQSTLSRYRSAPSGVLGRMLELRGNNPSLRDVNGLGATGQDLPAASHSAARSPLSSPQSPRSQQPHRGIDPDLQDLGGLLSEDREPDASAAALQQAMDRQHSSIQQGVASSALSHQSHPDDMTLHDPGGLLR